MTPATLAKPRTDPAMAPLPHPLLSSATAAAARRRMEAEDRDFLPPVAADDGTFLGLVLKGALQRACASHGHDPESCLIGLHLKTDVDTCSVGEGIRTHRVETTEVSGAGGFQARRARVRGSLPLIVLDDSRLPVGLLKRPIGR